MLSELLQDRAALYVTGAMPATERDAFEVLLEYNTELRRHVATLEEGVAAAALQSAPRSAIPPVDLKARILAAAAAVAQQPRDALVVTDAEGRVEWVNPEFTALCGYTLADLRGRKPGHVLQGAETDQAAVERLRTAVRQRSACRVELVNYHRDGSRYRAEIRVSPFLDDAGAPLWFVARERRLPD